MADTSDVTRTKSGRLSYRGQTFPGYNKQVRTSGENKKLVRYGDPNMTIKKDQPDRRKSFRARHNCDAVQKKKDVFSAAYHSCKNW